MNAGSITYMHDIYARIDNKFIEMSFKSIMVLSRVTRVLSSVFCLFLPSMKNLKIVLEKQFFDVFPLFTPNV